MRVTRQFAPEAVEAIVHGEFDHFDFDRPHLTLIDVEQRFQHIRHRAERFLHSPDHFLPCHLACEQPLQQRKRLQGLAQVLARRGEKARLGDARVFRLTLGVSQRPRRVSSFGDADERYDDAFDLLVSYKVEPYVVCADIYSMPPPVGRGGWTWYTGSAGWLQRAGVESVLGLTLRGATLRARPAA